MKNFAPFAGVLPAALTPFAADGAVDYGRFAEHCRWLLGQGVDGLVLFGTTGEGNSLSVAEKASALEALVEQGIPAATMLVGAGACALPDASALCRAAMSAGAGGVLVLPPFYYKEPTVEGLYAFYARLLDGVGNDRLRLYLYHIPPVAQVGIPIELIERLRAGYGELVAGIKDSSGDWSNTRALLDTFPGFGIFAGTERLLLPALRAGGAGCISALGNLAPAAIAGLHRAWQAGAAPEELDARQADLDRLRPALAGFSTIPMLKAAQARRLGDPGWSALRPPLQTLPAAKQAELAEVLAGLGFSS